MNTYYDFDKLEGHLLDDQFKAAFVSLKLFSLNQKIKKKLMWLH